MFLGAFIGLKGKQVIYWIFSFGVFYSPSCWDIPHPRWARCCSGSTFCVRPTVKAGRWPTTRCVALRDFFGLWDGHRSVLGWHTQPKESTMWCLDDWTVIVFAIRFWYILRHFDTLNVCFWYTGGLWWNLPGLLVNMTLWYLRKSMSGW
jgi:hypothetical protein